MIAATELRASSAGSMGRTERAWWIASLGLGLLALWVRKYVIYSDGISYLEIAGKYSAGDWHSAINAYWSPLYSWILGAAGWLLRPSPKWEVPTLHLGNFLAFAGSLFTFRFFLRQLTLFVTDNGGLRTEGEYRTWISVAYAMFLWGALSLTPTYLVTPDAVTNLLLYAIAGLVISVRRGNAAPRLFAVLGLLLALCYFARAAFLAAPAFFTLPLFVLVKPFRKAVEGSLIAAAVFIALVTPWVVVVSQITGHWTIGESGKLNYGWEVSGTRRSTHWQGEPGAASFPVHPTRKLLDSPPVFEFSTPIDATYPPWYDPSYWYEGLSPQVDLRRQLHTTLLNLRLAGCMLLGAPGLIWCILYAATNGAFRQRVGRLLGKMWWCWLPALCLIAGYSLVFIERRYIASAIVIIALTAVAAGFSGSLSRASSRAAAWLAVGTCVAFLASPVSLELFITGFDVANAKEMYPNGQFQVSREMTGLGLRKGAKIAYIGNSMNADWARLLGVRIVAEVPVGFDRSEDLLLKVIVNTQELESYWHATPETQQKVLEVFRKAGAEAVAADLVPEGADTSGWIRLEAPIYNQDGNPWTYLRFLMPPGQ